MARRALGPVRPLSWVLWLLLSPAAAQRIEPPWKDGAGSGPPAPPAPAAAPATAPAPPAPGAAAAFPEIRFPEEVSPPLPPLREGEAIHSQSFEIDPSGRFTYERSVRRQVGLLGAEVRQLDRDTAGRLNAAPFAGVLVVSVEKEGPAALAGLVRDDVIISFGGEPIRSVEQFSFLVEETRPGSAVEVQVVRDGAGWDFTVVLGGESRITASRAFIQTLPLIDDRPRTGLVLAEPSAEAVSLLRGMGLFAPGLLVTDLLPGGPAFFSAARRKDLLSQAAGRPTATAAEYQAAMAGAPRERVRLTLWRGPEKVETELRPERDATKVRAFKIPLLVSFETKAERSRLAILWGLLFHQKESHQIRAAGREEEHVSERELGFLLNLFRYRSHSGSRELRFLWLFPLSFEEKSRDQP
jgi:hypothetical protein